MFQWFYDIPLEHRAAVLAFGIALAAAYASIKWSDERHW